MKGKPIVFNKDQLKVFWKEEEWDNLIPEGGFLSDFTTSVRGVETPSKFALWSGIFLISSVLKRDSYLRWYPSKIFPNFFIVIVGPPRILGKSTVVDYGDTQILSKYHTHFAGSIMQNRKEINIVRKSTPEALSLALEAEQREWYDPETKKTYSLDRGSQVALIVSELSTFLGKQKYNMGLIDRLTKLYDCKDIDDERTITRGKQEYRNGYVTLYGATTRDGLENSIPTEAFGTGFMSRIVIVSSEKPTRSFPIPLPVTYIDGGGIDWPTELQMRLAWVAEKGVGEFNFSPEAKEAYVTWYHSFKKGLTKKKDEKSISMRTRMDNHLVKLMIILRAQRYEGVVGEDEARIITLLDFQQAQGILNATFSDSLYTMENTNASEWTKWYNRIQGLIRGETAKERRSLLTAMSPYGCNAVTVGNIIKQLHEEGKVRIVDESGKKQTNPSSKGKEKYIWIKREVNLSGLSTSDIEDKYRGNGNGISGNGDSRGSEPTPRDREEDPSFIPKEERDDLETGEEERDIPIEQRLSSRMSSDVSPGASEQTPTPERKPNSELDGVYRG